MVFKLALSSISAVGRKNDRQKSVHWVQKQHTAGTDQQQADGGAHMQVGAKPEDIVDKLCGDKAIIRVSASAYDNPHSHCHEAQCS